MSNKSNSSVSNIYQLEGRVPVSRAIPFGLQHILAMFVANISPIIIVAGASGVSGKQLVGGFVKWDFMGREAGIVRLEYRYS